MQEAYRNAMGANGEGPKIQMPSEDMLKHLPEDERLQQAAQAAKAAASAQGMVESLKSKAGMLTDPKQREKMLSEAYRNEVEAKGQSKKARILKSGTFQGGAGGAGIGMATGMGLGTVVGTLTGGGGFGANDGSGRLSGSRDRRDSWPLDQAWRWEEGGRRNRGRGADGAATTGSY